MPERALGPLLETFVNRVSHTRGRTIAFMSKASITVGQARLLSTARRTPDSSPSDLASAVRISLSSASQMIERLAKQGFLDRREDAGDRRRKTINATPKGKTFLDELRVIRSDEFAEGAAGLSKATRELLAKAIAQALRELESMSS
jgi:DNA-binding MarR family transcriptional regulator